MHELGHNLGLHHGGDDDINGKPNYLSVMNYSFSNTGIPGIGVTYSRWGPSSLYDLDEKSLSEPDGLLVKDGSVPAGAKTRYTCPDSHVETPAIGKPIDWNCLRKIEPGRIAADINDDHSLKLLHPYNDWTNLVFNGGNIGSSIIELPPIVPTF
jgi:hypothetical protein